MPVHTELSVIVDGAFEEDATFTDYLVEQAFIDSIEEEAIGHGYPVEVFRVTHGDHPIGADCECIQYEISHRPILSVPSVNDR